MTVLISYRELFWKISTELLTVLYILKNASLFFLLCLAWFLKYAFSIVTSVPLFAKSL